MFIPKSAGSLTRKTLIPIAASIAVVIAASTAISYFQVMSSIKSQTLEQLEKYVIERGQREKSIFTLAEDNHTIFKDQFLRRLQQSSKQDPKAQFDQLFVKYKDGVTRNQPKNFDGTQQVGVYIGKSVTLNADIRRRVMISYNLVNSYGPAWHNRFQDTYVTTPENILVVYWPEFPTWVQDAGADFYVPNEEYIAIADRKNNPSRNTVWTGVFLDKVSKIWMVTCTTPIDVAGKQIATIGHDVMLNDLLKRTVNDHIEGGYNLIFREDGRLIAHPKLMAKIQEQDGKFNILDSNDSHLKNIYQAAKNNSSGRVIIENNKNNEYLAITKIEGLNWYFVTIFPKSILTARAVDIARFTLLLGLLSLLIVIAVIFVVIRQQISAPLKHLMTATNRIAEGDFNISLEDTRQDELGRLAHSFNIMASEVEARTNELQKALQQQATSVHETTVTMDELGFSSKQAVDQAELAAASARQMLNLVESSEIGARNVLTLAEAGTKSVEQTVEGMSTLKEKVLEISEQIILLNQQANQISNITKLVTDLANQTNMLSLNAAVEAARAGENGKGFAVVASEIRKLADQSKKSADKINNIIYDIQNAINVTVMVTDEGKQNAEQGIQLSQKTAAAFSSVAQAINDVILKNQQSSLSSINDVVLVSQQISLTAKEQAVAIQQVVEAMNSLNQAAMQRGITSNGLENKFKE
ncbi:MAG TPA: methyl-accepting chemotaxis protein [Candidatus Obscuribacterales bacterium]